MTRDQAIEHFEDVISQHAHFGDGTAERLAISALQPWVRTADRAPTKEDAIGQYEQVMAIGSNLEWYWVSYSWDVIARFPDAYPYWMPIPPLPDHIADAGKKEADHA